MKDIPGEGSDELLRRMRDALADLLGRRTGGHLRGTLRDLAAEVDEGRRIHGDADKDGYERVAATQQAGDTVHAATPIIPHPVRTPTTDLSHMPPLGNLYDRAHRGEIDNNELTRELRGLQQQYGPYRLEDIGAYYEESWIGGDGSTNPSKINFTASIRDEHGNDAGETTRSVRRDNSGNLVVTNESTRLHDGFTRKGFSTAFSAAIEDYYRRSGVDRMELTASMDGAVVWAKSGYEWDRTPAKLGESVNNMRSRIDGLIAGDIGPLSPRDTELLQEMRNRFGGRIPEFPSPRELVMLAGDHPKLGEELMAGSYWHGVKKL